MKNKVPEMFGSMVFNDEVMMQRLPKDTYKALHKTIEVGAELTPEIANIVANAMKDWALEKGATHYTHWFQPMTGITAEKHDSFLSPCGDGRVIMEFSGKELIRGEPDASSFPSGGLRATFEARGYTAWDPTSYAFIKDDSLCIPTVFCSYTGEILDKKTPLLRSMEALNEHSLRILKLFGMNDVTRVTASVGAEQEYFLVDKKLFEQRKDLIITGRTLFGAKPPKGQEMEDHYFGVIKPRVMAFMKELNEELWKLGVYAKTEHNETAPSQHELAPIFTTVNVATDQNQIMMEVMKKVADRHGMKCLLAEKPFENVNGSGKHNNWSLTTNTGVNLLKPGKNPITNKLFLIFLCAVIMAVDENQDLLRISAASAGNDRRLGGSEAPPAIISMFLGSDITRVLAAVEAGAEMEAIGKVKMETGVHALPNISKDATDRNRTSPFAFTGNKFEFRMLGSSQSISGPNIMMNTMVADVLCRFADRLESAPNFERELDRMLRETIRNHKRIIFNGNNYSDEWKAEAKQRGLLDLPATPDALKCYTSQKNVELFGKHKIFSAAELRSRSDILYDIYIKTVAVEANTMSEMVRRDIVPAVYRYIKELAESIAAARSVGVIMPDDEGIAVVERLSELVNATLWEVGVLEKKVAALADEVDLVGKAEHIKDDIIPQMDILRTAVDEMETLVSGDIWPYPSYSELLESL